MTNDKTVVLLHGWGGNKPEHWQEWLKGELSTAGANVVAPKMPEPGAPKLAAWLIAMHEGLADLPAAENVTILCHSLGAITWMHYVTALTSQVADRVLLVAPPYVCREMPPVDTPIGIASFFPPPISADAIARAARETMIVAGEGDCYGTEDQTMVYSRGLNVPLYTLPGGGHLSPYWGYGEWPWVRDWALGEAGLPPLPK